MKEQFFFALTATTVTLHAAENKPITTGDPMTSSRTVAYQDTDIVPLATETGFTTLIQLPKEETILEVTCGDKDAWPVNWTGNLAYIKPSKAGSRTNLNLITASGNVYSFLVVEVTGNTAAHADLKLFVHPTDNTAIAAMHDKPRFVAAGEVDGYRKAAEQAEREFHAQAAALQKKAEGDKAQLQDALPMSIRHDYQFNQPKKNPFGVTAIYHDDKFTYIEATPQEAPAIYETKDGKPNLVEYTMKAGCYVIPKVLSDGYFRVGKAELKFHRQES